MKPILTIFILGIFLVGLVSAQTTNIDANRVITPSHGFYGLKIAVENIIMAFTFGDENKVNYGLRLAEKRIIEIQKSLEEGKAENLELINFHRERVMNEVLERAENLQDSAVTEKVRSVLQTHTETLERVRLTAHEEAHEGLGKAIEKSKGYEQGIKNISSGAGI